MPEATELSEVVCDADVVHLDGRSDRAGDLVDSRTTCREVRDHLPGDVLRVGRDTLSDDPVVARHQKDALRANRREHSSLDARDLRADRLHAAK